MLSTIARTFIILLAIEIIIPHLSPLGSIPEEWTNQEENQDDIAPLAEVQQKLKLRHARTVRTNKRTNRRTN